jgi:lipopolysaccharide heptosyltransferase I
MKVLIVKLGSIGDIVHTLPALAALRAGLPQAEISWVAERSSSEILKDNPILDRLIEVDTKALRRGLMSGETLRAPRQQLRRLRASAFDVALDFQGLIKSASIARLSGARRVFGYARAGLREPASTVFLSKRIPIPPHTHVIRKALLLLQGAMGISAPVEISFPIGVTRAAEAEAEQAAAGTGGNYAILNPGGGWPTKLWSAEKFGGLSDLLWSEYGMRSLVTFGPGEEDLAESVRRSSQSGNAIPVRVSLKAFYSLAKRARVYVGGDTGPTHIAVAASAPIVGLFGPTEWWRNGSPYAADICVERNDIDCRVECHRRACSKWICMDISVGRVFEAVERRINN